MRDCGLASRTLRASRAGRRLNLEHRVARFRNQFASTQMDSPCVRALSLEMRKPLAVAGAKGDGDDGVHGVSLDV